MRIKAKRGKQWYLWLQKHNGGWQCWRCNWQGVTEGDAGEGRTRDDAFADLTGLQHP